MTKFHCDMPENKINHSMVLTSTAVGSRNQCKNQSSQLGGYANHAIGGGGGGDYFYQKKHHISHSIQNYKNYRTIKPMILWFVWENYAESNILSDFESNRMEFGISARK